MLKGILITLGSLFLLLVIGFGTLAFKFSGFESDFESDAMQILIDLSENWDQNDIATRIDEDSIEVMNSEKSRIALQTFKNHLGPFVEAREVELLNYHSNTSSGTTGVFKVITKFEYALAEVTITLRKRGEVAKLQGIHIDSVTKLDEGPSET